MRDGRNFKMIISLMLVALMFLNTEFQIAEAMTNSNISPGNSPMTGHINATTSILPKAAEDLAIQTTDAIMSTSSYQNDYSNAHYGEEMGETAYMLQKATIDELSQKPIDREDLYEKLQEKGHL